MQAPTDHRGRKESRSILSNPVTRITVQAIQHGCQTRAKSFRVAWRHDEADVRLHKLGWATTVGNKHRETAGECLSRGHGEGFYSAGQHKQIRLSHHLCNLGLRPRAVEHDLVSNTQLAGHGLVICHVGTSANYVQGPVTALL